MLERPQGNRHPHSSDPLSPPDHSQLEDPSSRNGREIGVKMGSSASNDGVDVRLSADPGPRHTEIKLLLGCSSAGVEAIRHFSDLTAGVPCVTLLRG